MLDVTPIWVICSPPGCITLAHSSQNPANQAQHKWLVLPQCTWWQWNATSLCHKKKAETLWQWWQQLLQEKGSCWCCMVELFCMSLKDELFCSSKTIWWCFWAKWCSPHLLQKIIWRCGSSDQIKNHWFCCFQTLWVSCCSYQSWSSKISWIILCFPYKPLKTYLMLATASEQFFYPKDPIDLQFATFKVINATFIQLFSIHAFVKHDECINKIPLMLS